MRRGPGLPSAVALLTVILCLATVALAIGRRGLTGSPNADGSQFGEIVFAVVFSGVGLLIARARPRNVIGRIFLLSGLAWALGPLIDQYARAVLLEGAPDALGAAPLFAWFGRWEWVPLVTPAVLFAPMFFPDGRLLSRRWWPLPVGGLAGTAATAAAIGLSTGGDDQGLPGVPNPYGVDAPWVGALLYAGFAIMLLSLACTMVSLVIRMRRGNELERQQLKIFFFAALLWPILIVLSLTLGAVVPPVIGVLVLLALPISIGIAILRYRLYDIDLLINRTLVYGALTALLGLAYVGGIVLFQTLLRPLTSGSEIAVTASTLAVTLLFGPLRRRIQRGVDRRFYRRRYDAAATVDAFALRLRDSVDLDALTDELLGVVGDTVQPAHASVWLRERAR